MMGSRKEGVVRSSGEVQKRLPSCMDGEAAETSLRKSVETIRWARRDRHVQRLEVCGNGKQLAETGWSQEPELKCSYVFDAGLSLCACGDLAGVTWWYI